jgi:glucose-6-phosphate-specific signal transduction histidine kinase
MKIVVRKVLLHIAVAVTVNTLIAAFLFAIGVGKSFSVTLIVAQCIGLSIYAIGMGAMKFHKTERARLTGVAVAVPVGAILGVFAASHLVDMQGQCGAAAAPWQALLIGLIFGAAISALYYMNERMTLLEGELRTRQLRELEIDKQRVESQLKMLQAQIEPHFLFNTLANVGSLVESEPKLALTLLDALIRYLRASLDRTRAQRGTLGEEMTRLGAYLDVLKIRLGARLDYRVDLPDELKDRTFPPMLLQPLVENAVRHGIEPKREGGLIEISAERRDGRLCLAVSDNGVGFDKQAGSGVGLTNVRERLMTLFGAAAELCLEEGVGGGVVARLELPLGA